jgi:hypothetical protein
MRLYTQGEECMAKDTPNFLKGFKIEITVLFLPQI